MNKTWYGVITADGVLVRVTDDYGKALMTERVQSGSDLVKTFAPTAAAAKRRIAKEYAILVDEHVSN